jgi:hypothetical protein
MSPVTGTLATAAAAQAANPAKMLLHFMVTVTPGWAQPNGDGRRDLFNDYQRTRSLRKRYSSKTKACRLAALEAFRGPTMEVKGRTVDRSICELQMPICLPAKCAGIVAPRRYLQSLAPTTHSRPRKPPAEQRDLRLLTL